MAICMYYLYNYTGRKAMQGLTADQKAKEAEQQKKKKQEEEAKRAEEREVKLANTRYIYICL